MHTTDKDTKDTILSIRITEAEKHTLKQAEKNLQQTTSQLVRKT